ncbi:hypothetical protein C8F04DRAFT_659828 [Mycena alexandri]|uniref:Malate dehydrogenase n=1 Tax=Mycena alexandri TaxID=1745969 RepID=A0AAD6SRK5_9AGAR|nr:hypothetical protein C8F04DRAFT_659828 [Mycena alexandri]
MALRNMFALVALLPLVASFTSALPRVERQTGLPNRCNISAATMDLPLNQTKLVAPSNITGPSFIGVAIGTQNYTCASTGNWTNVGAVAQIFDASCLYGAPEFSNLPDIAYAFWKFAPPTFPVSQIISFMQPFHASMVLGQHYFVNSPSGTGVSPKWDFTSAALAGHPDAFVIGTKVGDIAAPTGFPDIDWLSLDKAEGSLATQVLRLNTVGGLPPASCTTGSPPIAIKYASMYWFYGSSVQ